MEGSELEQWESYTVETVCADEFNVVSIGNDECVVEIEVDIHHPFAFGAVVWHHDHDEEGHCMQIPVCLAWRYPHMN